MARTRNYKKLEKSIVHSIMGRLQKIFHAIGRGIFRFFKLFDRKLTIMIVPHSQSGVVNFRTNIFSLVAGTVIVLGVLASFFYFNQQSGLSVAEINRLKDENSKTLASLDDITDESTSLLQVAEQFITSLGESLALVGINLTSSQQNSNKDGDLNSIFDTNTVARGSTSEGVGELTSYLEGAVEPIDQIARMLRSQNEMLSNTPNLWPVKGGLGHITLEFGHAIHPITGKWYIHKGLDISTNRIGDPIIATANGQVVTSTRDETFGNYVIIQHKYGYLTRYAHLNVSYVSTGQIVSQGEVIGEIGDSGKSTGPHIHYEVRIGADTVDPANYVNIKTSN